MKELILFYIVKSFGFIVRLLPTGAALWLGRFMGIIVYYFNRKQRVQAYANLRFTFCLSRSPCQIKRITKGLFKNYGQNFIELFRLPLMNSADKFRRLVEVEGEENIAESLKKGKGVILLAMHFGSWEVASLSTAKLGYPYKIFVRQQAKYSKLDSLLNRYRSCGGSVVLSRGAGTRNFVKSLKNNEVVGMVVDQGGKDGVLVPFFSRQASMSAGAIRMGLKMGVPVCFSIIIRQHGAGAQHRMIIQKPLELDNTGDMEKDIISNLNKVTEIMEYYIRQYPSEYMWFYKIWKYSREASITILSDGKIGHLRQSQAVAEMSRKAFAERDIEASVGIEQVEFKNNISRRLISLVALFSCFLNGQVGQGFLKWLLTKKCFGRITAVNADLIISCGASVAGLNYLLSSEIEARSVVILKPSILSYKNFGLIILPQHDRKRRDNLKGNIVVTYATPNLITPQYLEEQMKLFVARFIHLKINMRVKIGVFIGGDSKNVFLPERQVKVLIHQLSEISEQINAEIYLTTSRRTPRGIEVLLQRELKKHARFPVLIIANRNDVPEAVGGILGMVDIAVVSGDSISMISEAASSGKNTIVFFPEERKNMPGSSGKHRMFIEKLNEQQFILASDVKDVGELVCNVAKNKIRSKKIDDSQIILDAVRRLV